ncbi:glycosyltransferase [Altererythrobacter endophyticus]|uniref:Glycosyltransferase n=1 Tax=Altericroceibacterium endophyticum TaxID=1808508 RepID=A0A6I4SZM7_9SPHN|nr:glycosyltransferase [Altericroceibacterium endophyticum]
MREGANRALNKLVGYLEREAGCTVRVYSPVTDTPAFEPEGTLVPVSSVALPVRGEFQLALGLPRSARRDLAHFDPQIVHVSTPDILGTRAQSWAISRGIPQVASMHTLFETYLGYYGLDWLRPLVEAHLNRFYRRADHVFAPTLALVDSLQDLRGDSRATVWSRGIDRALFSPSKRDMAWRRRQGIDETEVAVLFFGRLVKEKGIDIYREAIARLRHRRDVRALIVGTGPEAASFEGIDRAVLTGHLEGDELAMAVASADMMLAPSSTETFGQVMLEAMASGLPVVSADVPSARGLIVNGKTGLLCGADAIEQFSAAIEDLASDPARRAALGTAARSASAAYSWNHASESVAQIYRELLKKSA